LVATSRTVAQVDAEQLPRTGPAAPQSAGRSRARPTSACRQLKEHMFE
jgi:hypothetical protein